MNRRIPMVMFLGIAAAASANDWPYWRGPEQTGMTREKAVVTNWSLDGDNLLWRAPVRGRSTPIVMNGRVFVITPVGDGECLQERVIALDAETGKQLWEHRFNVFHTDIVENRVGWTSVVGDPETGNIYAHGTGGELFCFDRDGKVLWKRSLGEEFGRYSGYGGRLHTPVIDEDRVVISYTYILAEWLTGKNKSGHRYVAFDKRTGNVAWISDPGGKPSDTTYSAPVVAVIDGKRMLIGGNSDGSVYGMIARTGRRIWSYQLSKTGLNSSVVVDGNYVYASHSEENLAGTVMGAVVCIDGAKSGDLTTGKGQVWKVEGIEAGYSSPAVANGRLYVITNAANLHCLDAKTGKQHWEHKVGRVMKGSPVVTADGVIYISEVNSRFLVLRDAGDKCELLDEQEFTRPDGTVVELNGSPAVANGRVYFQTTDEMFCLGAKDQPAIAAEIPPMQGELPPDANLLAEAIIVPADVTLTPGESVRFKTQLFDRNGRNVGEVPAGWMTLSLRGRFAQEGNFIAPTDNAFAAGVVKAKVETYSPEARVRVIPSLPITEDFDGFKAGEPPPAWVGVDGKTAVVERDGTLVLQKSATSPSAPYSRMRAFSGPPRAIGYTVQADLMATPKEGRTPTLSDMGLINARYKLILLGFEKQVRLVAWSPIPRVQKDVPFDWQPATWYRAKLRVEKQGASALVRAKVWPRDEAEPESWTTELLDPCPNEEGSPGLYAFTKGTTPSKPGSLVFYDNYKVTEND
jgi:outer membrane protein assembly factor BamB